MYWLKILKISFPAALPPLSCPNQADCHKHSPVWCSCGLFSQRSMEDIGDRCFAGSPCVHLCLSAGAGYENVRSNALRILDFTNDTKFPLGSLDTNHSTPLTVVLCFLFVLTNAVYWVFNHHPSNRQNAYVLCKIMLLTVFRKTGHGLE